MPKSSTVKLTKKVIDAAEPGSFVWDSECKGFGVRVTPAGAKSFLFRYRADGKQRYEPIGKYPGSTVDEARAAATGLRAKQNVDHRAVREAAADQRRNARTVSDLYDHYLGPYASAAELRPSTVRSARGVRKLLSKEMLATKVEDVTRNDIRMAHGEASQAGGPYQANRLLAVLSRMFANAADAGWREEGRNPCVGVKKFPEEQRHRYLSPEETGRLLAACDAYDAERPEEHLSPADAVRLLLFTGARLQEVLKAPWSQFDLEVGVWMKPSSHTKTKRQHRVELDGPGLELLRKMRAASPHGTFLFPGIPRVAADGSKHERARADLKNPWERIIELSGLTDVIKHDLRRTTASHMASGGASLTAVGKTLGHTQASTTNRYQHLFPNVQREELRKAGESMVATLSKVPREKAA